MILTNPNQLTNPDNIGAVLIYPSKETTNELIQSAIKNNLIVNCIIDDDSENSFIGKSLSEQDYPSGCYIVINYQNKKDVSDITGTFSNNLQLGYRAAVIINKNDYKPNELTSISQYGIVVIDRNDIKNSVMSVPELLTVRSVSMLRDYTNVNYSNMGSHSYVGVGKDTSGLGGGRSIGYSTNGKDFNAVITPKGLVFRQIDAYRMWRLLKPKQAEEIDAFFDNRVAKEIEKQNEGLKSAVSSANDAVNRANQAVTNSKVNSDAIVAQSEAISEAKSAMDSATAEIQQTAANAASDAAKIRADVARVQNEVDTAKSANESTVAQIKSDISQTKDNLTAVNDKLTQAQSATNQAQSALREQVNQLSASVTANQSAITQAQTANDNVAKRLDVYASQASAQGETIKSVQSDVAGNTATIADINSNVTKVQQTADNLSASLKNADSSIASVKAQADNLSATLSNQAKSIASVTATATQIKSSLSDATGRLSTLEQTSSSQSATLSDVQKNLNNVTATATTLTNTLSNAQGSITKLQASAKSTQEQISDLQGNYTALQTTVNGLSTTVSNHDKSIESLQVTANGLTNSVKDAQGNISSLQATAKTLNSSMTDAQGRLSRVEQTATANSSTISSVNNKVDNIQVGGVNLLRNTENDLVVGLTALHESGSSEGYIYWRAADLVGGQTYTFSADIQGVNTNEFSYVLFDLSAGHFNLMPGFNIQTLEITKERQKFTFTVKKDENTYSLLLYGGPYQYSTKDMQCIYHHAKLEIGNMATDWSPAPEDVASSINQVKQTADANTATISDAKGDINSLKQTATSLQATLTNQGNDITQIKANANNLSSRISGVESSTNTLKDQTEWKTNSGSVDLNNFKTPCHEFLKGTVTNAPNEVAWWYLTVESSDDGNRVTQTVIADQSNNRYTRRWADSWSAWVKDATQADVTTLSNRITTNSTQITQNKQAIALKADQSTVDNLSGEVSQNKAQLKVQADQISSKVSGIETSLADANSKINDITSNGGGRNLLIGTSTASGDVADGSGTLVQGTFNGCDAVKTNGAWSERYINLQSALGRTNAKVGDWYTISVYVKADKQINTGGLAVYRALGNVDANTNDGFLDGIPLQTKPITTQWQQYAWNFQINDISLQRQNTRVEYNQGTGDNWIYWAGWMLEKGMVAHDWTPAPEDTITAIQKNSTAIDQTNKQISLKADQTEVNQVKGTASENSSRLDTMANEIKSKVTSTDVNNIVDGKGYATTSTVQSLITQKAGTINESITSLDAKYNTTVTQVQSLTASIDGLQSTVANKADKSQITQLSNVIQSKVGTADFNNLKRAVDMQTLDSADINNMKTNGHYFVHNLANNPVGGWVYVDVTGNGNDRIRQDVYQDNGNKHKYRRWLGNSWTNWSEGASESEITQLRDDINLRVKSGDLLSQINLTAHNTLIQSNKIYLDSSSTVFSGKAFIPSAAITSLEADKITTGTLNGIEIRQLETGGRSIDINNGNIAITSHDPYEPRISFTNDDKNMKMFNAVGDLEVINQEFALFNFTPEDTHSLNPIPFFKVTNTGQIGSGGAQLNMDHAIFDGYEWWTPSAGVTFGRTWNGVDKSSDYADIYAKSFVPHSELSAKTRIKKLDRKEALDKIMQDDMYTYQFKEDVRDGVSKRYASFIIDNIHDVAQYTEPEEFLSANGKGRDDGTQLAYLIAAVQYQQEQIEELKKKLEEK